MLPVNIVNPMARKPVRILCQRLAVCMKGAWEDKSERHHPRQLSGDAILPCTLHGWARAQKLNHARWQPPSSTSMDDTLHTVTSRREVELDVR